MIVSLVGRTTSGSSKGAGGNQPPFRTRFQAVVGHHGTLLGKPFHVLGLLFQDSSSG